MTRANLARVLEDELMIVERRLQRSGAGHYAKARLDAIVFVLFDQVPRFSDIGHAHDLETLRSRVEDLIRDYPELDAPRAGRNSKNAHRTEMLVDSILSTCGLRRRGALDRSVYVSRSVPADVWSGATDDDSGVIRIQLKSKTAAPATGSASQR